jgi:hypothetical protein
MQLYAGRSADQRCGFTALNAGNSGEPATRHDSARCHAAWRHQHRSDRGGYANAEHVGMRREHDDESGNARHDGTGQRHGRRGNAGRSAAGLLTGQLASPDAPAQTADASASTASGHANSKMPILKCYLVVRLVHQVYFLLSGPTALAPAGGGQIAAERTAHATPFAPGRRAALSGSLRDKPMAVAGC